MKVENGRIIIKAKAQEGFQMPRQALTGFTLVELMITILVIGVLAAIAVPSFADFMERSRIKGAAETIKSELQFAKSEALKQSCDIAVSFDTGMAWKVTSTICDGADKILDASTSKVSLSETSFTDDDVEFRFRRGDADQDNGAVSLSSDNYSLEVRVVDSRLIKICYPSDARSVSEYESCS